MERTNNVETRELKQAWERDRELIVVSESWDGPLFVYIEPWCNFHYVVAVLQFDIWWDAWEYAEDNLFPDPEPDDIEANVEWISFRPNGESSDAHKLGLKTSWFHNEIMPNQFQELTSELAAKLELSFTYQTEAE